MPLVEKNSFQEPRVNLPKMEWRGGVWSHRSGEIRQRKAGRSLFDFFFFLGSFSRCLAPETSRQWSPAQSISKTIAPLAATGQLGRRAYPAPIHPGLIRPGVTCPTGIGPVQINFPAPRVPCPTALWAPLLGDGAERTVSTQSPVLHERAVPCALPWPPAFVCSSSQPSQPSQSLLPPASIALCFLRGVSFFPSLGFIKGVSVIEI